jgi:hypothetical protein
MTMVSFQDMAKMKPRHATILAGGGGQEGFSEACACGFRGEFPGVENWREKRHLMRWPTLAGSLSVTVACRVRMSLSRMAVTPMI